MNKQKSQANPFRQKSDHIKKKYEINNNNNNGKNGIISINQKYVQKSNPRYVQPIFNYQIALKSCLKINDKSKGGEYNLFNCIFR